MFIKDVALPSVSSLFRPLRSARAPFRLLLACLLAAGTLSIAETASADGACAADLNADGAVNAFDLAGLLGNWNGSGAGDVNNDGSVTAADLAALLSAWGPCVYSTQLVGRVEFQDGSAAAGALVVSSLGGSQNTSNSGAFGFAVQYTGSLSSVVVDASVVVGGIEFTASKVAKSLVAGGVTNVGTLVVATDCPAQFRPRFGSQPGLSDPASSNAYGAAFDSVVYDAGFGPELIVWGPLSQAGSAAAPGGMAAFNGHSWRAFGTGVYVGNVPYTPPSEYFADFAVANGELYVCGAFNRVNSSSGSAAPGLARWDRTLVRWVPLPALPVALGGSVPAMCAADFGGSVGTQLVVAFNPSGSGFAPELFRLAGSSWVSLGNPPISSVSAIIADQASTGLRIVAVGAGNGGVTRWSLATGAWEFIVDSSTTSKTCAAIFGGELYVGGGAGVRRWTGASWVAVGSLGTGTVECLEVLPISGVQRLVAGRSGVSNGQSVMALVNGAWQQVGSGPYGQTTGSGVSNLNRLDSGTAEIIYASGDFRWVEGGSILTPGVARYQSSSWRPAGRGIDPFVETVVSRIEGGQTVYYVGGSFIAADGVALNGVARWDGTRFTGFGSGRPNTRALCFHDAGDGLGELLYAASGTSKSVARWTGSGWQEMVPNLGGAGTVKTLLSVVDGSGSRVLYAGGDFNSLGAATSSGAARLRDGIWENAGNGLSDVRVIGKHAVAGVQRIFAGGNFSTSGDGSALGGIAFLATSSNTWVSMNGGLSSPSIRSINALSSRGGKLYVGGTFLTIASTGAEAAGVAVWDGTAWSPLVGLNGETGFTVGLLAGGVNALEWIDLGGGLTLVAAGDFTATRGTTSRPMNRLSRWNGENWVSIDAGFSVDNSVRALTKSGSPGGIPGLILGGYFSNSAAGDSGLAEWSCN